MFAISWNKTKGGVEFADVEQIEAADIKTGDSRIFVSRETDVDWVSRAIEAHLKAQPSVDLAGFEVTVDDPAAVDAMAAVIQAYLRRKSGVSIAELSRDVPGFNGEEVWGSSDTNVIMWLKMSSTAISAVTQLISVGKINATPANVLVYAYDGAVLEMPIATSLKRKYAKPHWFPLVFAGNREAA